MKFRNIGLATGLNIGVIMTVIGLMITQVAAPSLDWNDGGGGLTVIFSLFFYALVVGGGYLLVAIGLGLILISVIGWAFAKFYSTLDAEGKKRFQIGTGLVIVSGLAVSIALLIAPVNEEPSEPVAKVVPEGPFTLYHRNGQKEFEGSYDGNGLIQGAVTAWYESGQKKYELSVTDGELNRIAFIGRRTGRFESFSELDGRAAYWYENGQMSSEEFYVDNQLNGLNRTWRQDGTLQWEMLYKDDGTAMWKCYDEEGRQIIELAFVETRSNVISEIPDVWERIANVNNTWTCSLSRRLLDRGVAGLFHGTWKFWHDNGNLGFEQGWKNGKKHGVEVSRWSSGGKIREENYVDGQRHGVSRKWYKGQLEFDSIYENGRLIKTDVYDSKGVLIDPSTGQPIE